MNTFSHFHLIPFVLFLFSLLSPSSGDTYTLINQICYQTSDYGYCIEILRNNQTSSTDLKTLIRITVDKSVMLANDNEIFIQKSMAADEHLKELFAGCDGNYQQFLGPLRNGKNDCDNKDYSHILGLYQRCIRPVIECQSPQMLENNGLMRVLISMGFYERKATSKIFIGIKLGFWWRYFPQFSFYFYLI